MVQNCSSPSFQLIAAPEQPAVRLLGVPFAAGAFPGSGQSFN
ncbi:hypothetical protein OEB94_36375 [Streptomyces sp. ICN988]|nr:hypothetical protein [Streptomyces sp. ICN988]MCV2464748.1 hypothetical protein [Streptomyces sp. ICN988]